MRIYKFNNDNDNPYYEIRTNEDDIICTLWADNTISFEYSKNMTERELYNIHNIIDTLIYKSKEIEDAQDCIDHIISDFNDNPNI